jgi:NAD+ diphosphatase
MRAAERLILRIRRMQTPDDFAPAHAGAEPLPPDALAFAFDGARLLVRERDDVPGVPALSELHALGVTAVPHYLGALAGRACVALALPEAMRLPDGWRTSGLRALFFRLPDVLLAIAGRAFQVLDFVATHRFCGRCATPLLERAGERARECPACALVAYPRVAPAMMALVIREREILLARAPRFPGAMYSALAGFVEPGETLEDCVHREVREEVGLEVTDLRYFGSQSWPFPHSLMLAFTARYAGGAIVPQPGEIADARWFALDALPELPSPMSIARRLIDATVAHLRTEPARPAALE